MSKFHQLRRLAVGSLVFAAAMFMFSGNSSAATFNVAAGDDLVIADGNCSLSEALGNSDISAQAPANPDCPAGDGINDTLILPVGTIMLQADLATITHDITIQGQGMGQTIIDGNSGQYRTFSIGAPATSASISGLSIVSFNNVAIEAGDVNLTVSQVEIDGAVPIAPFAQAGINTFNNTGTPTTINISDTYIHGIHALSGGNLALGAFGIVVSANSTSDVTANIQRVTVSDIQNDGNAVGIELAGGFGGSTGVTIGNVENVTVDGITSTGQLAAGIGVIRMSAVSASTSSSIRNSTITNVTSQTGAVGNGGGILVAGGGIAAGAVSMVNVDTTNNLMANNTSNGVAANCQTADMTAVFGGAGSGTATFSSYGGNLVDDSSCSTYLIEPTDQNNAGALTASLSALANNGGFVPTRALLDGSPAIDAGVVAAGLASDARGQARPQGNGFDAGAYEFEVAVVPPVNPTDPTAPVPTPAENGSGLANSGQPILVGVGLAALAIGLAASYSSARTRIFARLRG